MANISISLEGIDQAIANLNYRPNSVKQKAILAIMAFYTSEESIKQLDSIDTDILIKSIWDVGDNLSKIKAKRRNFSSIKSSINADLEKISKKGQNPENIIITDSNVFDMTQEAKNNLLSSFTDAVKTGDIDLDQATNLLKTVTAFLENFQLEDTETDSNDIVNQIKKILNKITEDVLSEEDLESTPGLKRLKKGAVDLEEIELDEDEEIEEVDDLDQDETLEEIDDIDEDVEEIQLDEDEELEEIDALDEDVEEIELEEDEEIEELEEIEIDENEELEEIELDEDEELEEVDDLDQDETLEEIDDIDEDVEEIQLDEDEELEEIDALDEDVEEIELEEDEEIEEIEEIEIDENEELEEIELDEDEELEEVDDLDQDETLEEIDDIDEDVEEIQLDEDEELEEIDALDEDVEKIELEEDEELEEIEIDENEELEEIELDEDEELEEVDDLDQDETLEEIDDIDEDVEEIQLDEDEELEEIDALDEELEEIEDEDDIEEIELDEDEELEEIELDEDEALEEVDGLDEDELKALEEYRKKKELAEHFDDTLGEREKKYNKYTTVPEGKYTVGTKKSIKSSLELQPFDMPKVYIGIYPVTNSLFEIFIEETGYVTTAEKLGYGRVYSSRFKKNTNGSTWNKNAGSQDIKGACWYKPFGPDSTLHGKRNHPVVQVSVDDAIAFASWIGRRIPTEAEWESAARTDMGYRYPWGNEFNPNATNIEQNGLSDTSAVDEYDAFANEFKIVDMLGNVMEWTCDMENPPIKLKKNAKYCVAKGAAWNAKNNVTISSRALFKPGFTSNTIGFRCISEIFL